MQFLADDSPQSVLELRGLSIQVLTKGRIDQRLVTNRTACLLSQLEETVNNLFIESDGDSSLTFGFRFWRLDPPSFSLAEIVMIFHNAFTYSSRSCGCAARAEMLAESRVIVGYRDCVRVVKDWDRFGQTDAVLDEVQSGFTGFVPLKSHALIVCMSCAYTAEITKFASTP